MMTFEEMLNAIKELGNDAYYTIRKNEISVSLNDFEGFDESGEEIYRDYDNEEAVESFEEMLEKECLSYTGDFYREYVFDGFVVILGYESFDI